MNPNYENQNIQNNINNIEDQLNLDTNGLNEVGEPNLNLNNAEMDYMTDSDIEDPKYMPTGNILPNTENFENPQNLESLGVPSENQMLLQTKIMNLENDTMLANKTLQQLENENDQLKTQLMKNQEKIKKKEGINNEFKQLLTAFKQRFAQYEKRNNYLRQYINQLEAKLKQKEIELLESLKGKNKSISALKNADIYKQYEKELQNEFKENTRKLNQKYIDKENNLKNEFM